MNERKPGRVYRTTRRTPEEVERDREVRERMQAWKPTMEELEARGAVFRPLGEVLASHAHLARLANPERSYLSGPLADLAAVERSVADRGEVVAARHTFRHDDGSETFRLEVLSKKDDAQ